MNIEITLMNEDGEVVYRRSSASPEVIEMCLGDIEKLLPAPKEITDF